MPILTSDVSKSVIVRKKANWLHSPQRVWLRRAIFQVHLWIGVALTLYCVVIGLSGSALVFRPEIQDALHSNLVHIQPEPRTTSYAAAVKAIEADRPGWLPVGLQGFDKPERATILLLHPVKGPATSDYRVVAFNPYTGKVLLDGMRNSDTLGWLANLHFYLLAGNIGLAVSGWMAVGLFILCLSGLVLWWPGIRRWASALVLRRRSRWQRTNWDLHVVVGFWSCLLLLGVTFTGIYFAFPEAVKRIVVTFTGDHSRPAPSEAQVPSAQPARSEAGVLSIDQALAIARKAMPATPPAYFYLPNFSASRIDPYSATGYYPNSAPYSQLVQVTLDIHSGAILAREDTRTAPLGDRIIQYFYAVHFGSFGGNGIFGVIVKVLWVLLGITPAMLGVTGLLMYWNRKLRPIWIKLRS